MDTKKDKISAKEKGMRGLQVVFGVVVFCVFVYFFLGEILLPKEGNVYGDKYRVFEAQWYEVSRDGTRTPIEVPGECHVARGELAVIEALIPDTVNDRDYLCFRGSQQDMKIYIDGELHAEYSTEGTRLFGKTSASAYVFVEINSEDAGKIIRVETISDSRYSGLVNVIYIGERMSIWSEFIGANGLELVVAVFMIVLGIISIAASILLRVFYDKNIMLEYLGWGIVLAAIWIVSESKLRQLFFPNTTIIASMAFIVIMVLPLPFLIYMNSIQNKRYQPAYMLVAIATVINLIVSTVLQVLNIKDFMETMIWAHVIIVVGGGIICFSIFKDIRNGHIKEYNFVATGLLGFLLTGIIEMVRVYQMEYGMTGVFLCAGLIFLLIMACIKTGRDVIEAEREKQRTLLSQATQVGFLAHMSHEIRTPLNTVIGMNDMILREDISEVVRRYAGNVKTAGKTLEALISDVLDFSKIQRGGFDIESAPYYLASLVNDSIHLLKASVENKRLEVRYNIDENIPSVVKGDEIRIKRILNVLMENAVKYTDEGCITLSIQGDISDDGRFILKMSVADTGKGIHKEDLNNIFDNFVSLGNGKNKKAEGIGLGLGIVKRFVEQMGGDIKVNSIYGKGSLFAVRIPQEIVNAEPIGDIHNAYTRECAADSMVIERLYAPDAAILVVDDNEMNLEVVKGILKRSEIMLDLVAGGKECLAICREKKYDLILMDHMMPEPDGIETLHLIRNDIHGLNRETEVIVLTANAVSGIREKYLKEGFSDYLSKPVEAAKLEKMLSGYLKDKASFKLEEKKEVKASPVFFEAPSVSAGDSAEQAAAKHIDSKVGLNYCANDEEMYIDVLNTYYEQGNAYINGLLSDWENKDWKSYSVKAHALKSSSLTIGAREFSELAKKHEFAGKEDNEEFISAGCEAFIAFYREVLDEIKAMLNISDSDTDDTEHELEAVEVEQYIEMGKVLLSHIRAYEMGEVLELVGSMMNKTVIGESSEEEAERMAGLKDLDEAVNDFNYEEAERIISEWLAGREAR